MRERLFMSYIFVLAMCEKFFKNQLELTLKQVKSLPFLFPTHTNTDWDNFLRQHF